MALTPQEELKKLIAELRKASPDDAVKFDNIKVKDFALAIKKIKDELDRVTNASSELADNFASTTSSLDASLRSLSGIDKILASKIRPELKKLDGIIKNTKNLNDEIIKGYATEKQILNNVLKLKRSINNITSDTKNLSTPQIEALKENLKSTKAVAESQLQIVKNSKEATQNISGFADILSEIPVIGKSLASPFKDVSEEIENNIKKSRLLKLEQDGLVDETKNLQKIASKVDKRLNAKTVEGLINQASKMKGINEEGKRLVARLQENRDKVQEINDELERTPSALKSIKNKFKEIFKSFTVFGIATKFIQTIGKELVAADKSATELARKFNMSKSAALELRHNIRNANREQGSYLTTTNDVLQTMMSLQDTTGRFVALRQQDLQTATELLKVVKLTEKATAGLTQMSQINNTSLKDTEKSILGSSVQLQAQTGLFIDNKQLLEDIGGLSDTLRVKFKNNAEEMALTVTRSRQLGFSMEALSQVQDNILNFESSIAAELEAELLTGKELTLEKARYYALTNQQAKLQEEIVHQVGTLNEFEGMNVLQQKAYAQALGMSVDDLSKILLTQEQNAAIQKEINKDQKLASLFDGQVNKEKLMTLAKSGDLSREQLDALGEATGENLRQLSIQEKMEKTMTRLSEIFLSVMDPIISVVDLVDKAITGIGKLLSDMGPGAREGLGRALALIGGGAFIASIAKLLTKGTFMNPMITAPITGGGIGGKITSAFSAGGARGALLRGGAGLAGAAAGTIGGTALGGGGTGSMIGSAAGSIGGGLLGQALIPIPGVGFMIGSALGGLAGGYIGGGFDQPVTPMATGGIVTAPTRALVGEAGPEAVLPLDQFTSKLDELIAETRNIANMRVQLETGVIAGHMTNGGTKTG